MRGFLRLFIVSLVYFCASYSVRGVFSAFIAALYSVGGVFARYFRQNAGRVLMVQPAPRTQIWKVSSKTGAHRNAERCNSVLKKSSVHDVFSLHLIRLKCLRSSPSPQKGSTLVGSVMHWIRSRGKVQEARHLCDHLDLTEESPASRAWI